MTPPIVKVTALLSYSSTQMRTTLGIHRLFSTTRQVHCVRRRDPQWPLGKNGSGREERFCRGLLSKRTHVFQNGFLNGKVGKVSFILIPNSAIFLTIHIRYHCMISRVPALMGASATKWLVLNSIYLPFACVRRRTKTINDCF